MFAYLYSLVAVSEDECAVYVRRSFVDPFWEVSILKAFVVTLTTSVFEPLEIIAECLRNFVIKLFTGIPLTLYLPVFIVTVIFIALAALMLFMQMLIRHGYRVRLPFLFAAIEPSHPPPPAPLNKTPHPQQLELEVEELRAQLSRVLTITQGHSHTRRVEDRHAICERRRSGSLGRCSPTAELQHRRVEEPGVRGELLRHHGLEAGDASTRLPNGDTFCGATVSLHTSSAASNDIAETKDSRGRDTYYDADEDPDNSRFRDALHAGNHHPADDTHSVPLENDSENSEENSANTMTLTSMERFLVAMERDVSPELSSPARHRRRRRNRANSSSY